MTNLQALTGQDTALGGGTASTRHLLLLPLAVGGVLSVLLLGVWVIPQLQKLNEANARYTQKQATAARLPVLRQQLDQTIAAEQRAQLQQSQLLALIAGSGDLATFMTQVDREAQRHGVQLDVLQPGAAVAVDPKQAARAKKDKKEDEAAAAPPDPLTRSGLQVTQMQLKAAGEYPNLLAFMRAMERLTLLVRQSDFSLQQLAQPGRPAAPAGAEAQPAPTTMAFTLSLYSPKPSTPAPAP